jgi:hypothetical protein
MADISGVYENILGNEQYSRRRLMKRPEFENVMRLPLKYMSRTGAEIKLVMRSHEFFYCFIEYL